MQQFEFNPKIIIDDREDRRVVSLISKYPTIIENERLICADYVLSDRVAIERKTDSDFQSSLMDGRLFTQASEIGKKYQCAIIAIIGKNFDKKLIKAINGAIISLSVDFHLPIMFFDNDEKFALFLFEVAKREQFHHKRNVAVNSQRKPTDIQKEIQFIVESLPGIGPVTAQQLLAKFQTIENLMTANEEQLKEVAGIGPFGARKIRLAVSTKFELKLN